jgi:GH35 family endo-1,4-beta-xylanase
MGESSEWVRGPHFLLKFKENEMNLEGRTVRVTRECIRKGKPDSENMCPIARAIRPLVNKKAVKVYGMDAYIGDYSYELPDEAAQFVDDFDSGLAVKPFSFKIGERYL